MQDLSELKTAKWEFKTFIIDREKRIIGGFATTERPDRDREIVDFKSVRDSFTEYMANNAILILHHDLAKPAGKVIFHEEGLSKAGFKGIKIQARIGRSNSKHADCEIAWEMIEQGMLNAFSIRYQPVVKISEGKDLRRVIVRDLQEITLTSVGSNPDTLIDTVIKSLKDIHLFEDEDELDEETLTKILKESNKGLMTKIDTRFEEIEKKFESETKSLKIAIANEDPKTWIENMNEADQKSLGEYIGKQIKNAVQMKSLNKATEGTPGPGEKGEGEDKDDDPPKSDTKGLDNRSTDWDNFLKGGK